MADYTNRQAREMEEMYRFLFAHPLVEAITGWDFADGGWLGAPSGVLSAKNRRKPSYEMLHRLIHEEWKTFGEIRTDENGFARVHGFKGDYCVEDGAGAPVGTFRLTADKERTEVLLKTDRSQA